MALMAATAIWMYLCYLMALPFLPALTWALALAVLFMPIHRRLESTLKHPNLAASATILLIGSIVVVPAAFIGQRLISEAVLRVQRPPLQEPDGRAAILVVARPGGTRLAGSVSELSLHAGCSWFRYCNLTRRQASDDDPCGIPSRLVPAFDSSLSACWSAVRRVVVAPHSRRSASTQPAD